MLDQMKKETLRQILRVWMVEVSLSYPDQTASFAPHVPIYAAISARDVQAARAAMREHLDSAGARLLAVAIPRGAAAANSGGHA